MSDNPFVLSTLPGWWSLLEILGEKLPDCSDLSAALMQVRSGLRAVLCTVSAHGQLAYRPWSLLRAWRRTTQHILSATSNFAHEGISHVRSSGARLSLVFLFIRLFISQAVLQTAPCIFYLSLVLSYCPSPAEPHPPSRILSAIGSLLEAMSLPNPPTLLHFWSLSILVQI